MLKVAQICNYYHNKTSGVTTVIDTIIRHLIGQVEFDIFCLGKNQSTFKTDLVTVHRYKELQKLSKIIGLFVRHYFPLTSLCFENLDIFKRYDVLHFHTLWPNSIIPLIRFSQHNIPKVMTLHGGIDLMLKNEWPIIYQKLVKKALKSADRVIIFDSSEEAELNEFCSGLNSVVLGNGIDCISTEGIENTHPLLSKLDDHSKIVLFVGTVNKRKGSHELIEIARDFNNKGENNFSFVFIGDVTTEISTEDIPKNVHIVGPVEQKGLIAFYKRADMLVLPSYSEGMPMVILEAMAYGLPVISTNVGAIPSIIIDKKSGFILNPGDKAGLKKCILDLTNDSDKTKVMGQVGMAMYNEKYTGSIMAKNYYDVYKSVSKNKNE